MIFFSRELHNNRIPTPGVYFCIFAITPSRLRVIYCLPVNYAVVDSVMDAVMAKSSITRK